MSKTNRILKDPETFRKNIVSKLQILTKDESISINLEKGIFNYTINTANKKNLIKKWSNELFVTIYIEKLKMVLFNIKNNKLYDKLLNKEIKAHELAFMSHEEMRPDIWDQLIEFKKKEIIFLKKH